MRQMTVAGLGDPRLDVMPRQANRFIVLGGQGGAIGGMETCDLVGARQRRSMHRPSYLVLGDVVVRTNAVHDKGK